MASRAGPARPERAVERPRFSSFPFTLGVASGAPLPDGVVLWTRLAPEPLRGGGAGDDPVVVRWEVAEDEGFTRIVRRGSATVTEKVRSANAPPESVTRTRKENAIRSREGSWLG